MPVEQTTEPVLTEVTGHAEKQVSIGILTIDIRIAGDPANGWPPADELDLALLELFNAVGYEGWVGTVSKRYLSSSTLAPNPPAA